MARTRNYDDISDDRVSRRGTSSSKLLLAVILLSIVICAVAVLIWVKILETQDTIAVASSTSGSGTTANVVEDAKDKSVTSTSKQTEPATQSESPSSVKATVSSKLSGGAEETGISVSLSIDDALSRVGSGSGNGLDYISSSDYSLSSDADGASVTEESVEMKKPTIAQNLSITQQNSFTKDMVRYSEYRIKEGDSLPSIASSFGLNLQTIISVNQIKSTSSLWIGSSLQIPDRDGTLYLVKEGDTLLSITQQYGLGISPKTLGDVNGLLGDSLQVGQKLFIPYETLESSGTITASEEPSFISPASGTTIGMYNQKVANPLADDMMQLDGILIQGESGQPVCASEAGIIVDKGFNDNGSGFVKIMHNSGYTTYYNYLSDVLAETADKVEKGQRIASFGDGTSNYSVPTIFFRIEQDGISLDPHSFI